jgi:hypothetical protein
MTVELSEGIKNINRFPGAAVAILILVDKHFPQDCRERRELLETCELFDLLWQFHVSLEQIQKTLDLIRSTGAVPTIDSANLFDALLMAISLEKLSATLPNKEAQQTVKTAGEFMHRWYTLEPMLERLMKESSKLRLGLAARQAPS